MNWINKLLIVSAVLITVIFIAVLIWEHRDQIANRPDTKGLILVKSRFVDLEAYQGTWYEQYRINNWFEDGLDYVSARYTLRKDGMVSVVNKGYSCNGKESVSKGIARRTDTNAVLMVSFFPFIEGAYCILYLDDDMSVVGSPNRKSLWLLSRKETITDDQVTIFMNTALKNNYSRQTILEMIPRGKMKRLK